MRVRLTPAEKKAFTRLAESSGTKPASLLRRMIREAVTGEPDPNDEGLASLSHAANQLAAVGRNLNQIARAVNRREVIADPITTAELEALDGAVSEVKGELLRIIRNCRSRSLVFTGKAGDL